MKEDNFQFYTTLQTEAWGKDDNLPKGKTEH